MNQREANAVANAIGFADGGCPHCVELVADRLNAAGLGFVFVVNQAGRKADDPHDGEWVHVDATEPTEENDMHTPEIAIESKTTTVGDATVRESVRRMPHLRTVALQAAVASDAGGLSNRATDRILDRAIILLEWLKGEPTDPDATT